MLHTRKRRTVLPLLRKMFGLSLWLAGAALASHPAHAQSGNMLAFTGTANSVTVPHVFSQSQFGYEFWFRPAAVGTAMNVVVYSDANGPMQTYSHQVRLNANGNVVFYVYRQDLLTAMTITSNRRITAGEWVHVGVNWQDLVGGELYLDGVLEGSFNGGGVPAQVGVAWKSGINLHFGSAAGGLSAFNGNIDEFRIWSGGVGPNTFHPHATTRLVSPFPTGLTDYWNFDSATSGAIANVVTGRAAVQMTSGATLAYSALPAFLGGDGSSANPYQVGFAGQLNQVRNHLSANFLQTRTIDLTAYRAGAGWLPIGDFFNPFTGTYNGQGFAIASMRQSRGFDVGLFGVISGFGALVEKVKLVGSSSWATSVRIGSLAGYVRDQATVRDIAVEGTYVNSASNTAGGIIGRLGNGARLLNSYSNGQVWGSEAVGGLVGLADGNSVIRNVYSHAQVFATTVRGGGIVGMVDGATLENAYAFAQVSGASSGAILGTYSGLTSSGLYHLAASGVSDVGAGASISTSLTDDQLRVQDLFAGWDFITIWQMVGDGNASFPFLRTIPENPPPGFTTEARPVILILPVSGLMETSLRPTFTWSGQANQLFDLQISSSPVFGLIEEDVMNLSTMTFTPSSDLEPGIAYHWRVRSKNPETNVVSDWTVPRVFTTSITFDGGEGTALNPYLVRTPAQLNHIRNFRTAHFVQTSDINIAGFNQQSSWTPLGTMAAPFSGTFDGQQFEISGLTQTGTLSDAGLFGVISGSAARVRNVRLTGVNISLTGNHVGALAGWLTAQAQASGSSVEGSISGNQQVGGLIGTLNVGTMLTTSYSLATVSGSDMVGGLVGQPWEATVRNVYSMATVTATNRAGGLFGNAESSTLQNAYADATITGATRGQITGSLSGTNAPSGLYFSNTSGIAGAGTGQNIATARTRNELRDAVFFPGWDFDTVWQIEEVAYSYPFLRGPVQSPAPGFTTLPQPVWLLTPTQAAADVVLQPLLTWTAARGTPQYEIQISENALFTAIVAEDLNVSEASYVPTSPLQPGITHHWRVRVKDPQAGIEEGWSSVGLFVTTSFDAGIGTEQSPYQIRTAAQLNRVRNFRNAHFIQTAAISLDDFTSGAGWVPLGTLSTPFSGTYNGQNFTISGLTQSGDLSNAGLFGVISGSAARVRNVRLTGVNISVTGNHVGALAGWVSTSAQVSGSSVEGSISGNLQVGGLIGTLYIGTTLTTSYSLATVSGSDLVGGLVGQPFQATVQNVYSMATVTATNRAGGLFGNAESSTLQNAFADATVTGATRGQIAGSVSGSNTPSGLYFRSSSGRVGVGTGQNIATARTPDQLRVASNFEGWDFTTVWQMVQEQDRRSYPFLRSSVQAPAPGLLTGPSVPELIAPANSATQVAVQPEFSWQSALLADRYDVHISRDAGFLTIEVSASNLSTTAFVPDVQLIPNEVYHWRVRSRSSATQEESAWSEVGSFTTNPFTLGDGTVANPYQVNTAAQLNSVRNFRNAHFIQTAAISLDDFTSGAGWVPFGTDTSPFSGTYNGQNFTISGLTQSGDLSNAGLFGVISGSAARVRNVRLTGVNISVTGNHVGALAGWVSTSAQVSGSSVEGSISGNLQVGGLIGTLYIGTTLTTSYSLATVSGSDLVGGLVGQPFQATVRNVYSLATVTATSNAGGLFGNVHSSTLQNAYADATITGATRGQISGSLSGTNAPSGLYFSNASGLAGAGTGQNIATAYPPSQLRVPQLFVGWDFDTVWQTSSGVSTSYPYLRGPVQTPPPGESTDPLPMIPFAPALNAVEVPLLPTFAWTAEAGATQYEIQIATDDTFTNIVVQDAAVTTNSFVPDSRLESFQVYFWRVRTRSVEEGGAWTPVMTFRSASFDGGTGTAEDPYQVATAAQLNRMRNFRTAHFIQTADISLEDYASGNGWVPIGQRNLANPSLAFTGRYNGQFHTISNLTISGSISSAGLFGYLGPGAIVENLHMVDVNISGSGDTRGAIAGRTQRANIWKVSVSGVVAGRGQIGGIVGYMSDGMIFGSYSRATVSGAFSVGGVIGTLENGFGSSLNNVYSVAEVSGTSSEVGGIVGSVTSDNVQLTLSSLYSDAVVSGARWVGMIAGYGLHPSHNASRASVYFSSESGLPGHGNWDWTSMNINQQHDLPGARTRDQLRDAATFWWFDFDTVWDIKRDGEASFPFLREVPQSPAPGYLTTPNAPIPQTPAWSTTVRTPEFRWSVAPPADRYELEVATDALFAGGGTVITETDLSTNTFTPAQALEVGTYYWRVRGKNTVRDETGAWSAPQALVIVAFSAGDGTQDNPYRVSNAAELFATREFRAAHFRQTADINLQPVGHWNPIGSRATPFTGRYDGQRFVISGLTQSGRLSNVGLFGVLSGATVSNLNLTDVDISVALDSVGAVAGLAMANSLVQGSSVEGTISGRLEVGGLLGRSSVSNILTSYTVASVTGVARVGGLVGILQESGMRDSYSLASVTAQGSVPLVSGGSPLQSAGGLAGYLLYANVQRVYADAAVTAPNSNLAGQIAGSGFYCSSSGRLAYNQDRGQAGVGAPGIFMQPGYCGLGNPFSPLQLRSRDTYFGWDFTTTWQINQGTTASYPYLRAAVQSPPPGFLEEGFFAGGTGTAADPYLVATAAHLSNVRFFPNSHFIQTADISLAHIPNWQPIDPTNGFNGVYNGQQFRIVGLTISGAVNNAGLFSQTSGQSGAVIENVRLVEVNIQSTGNTVGGLVGYLRTGTVRNSSVSGSIAGGNNVGGLIGFVQDVWIPLGTLYSNATVLGNQNVGGLIGYAGNLALENVYSLANVTATAPEDGQAGGLVGAFQNGLSVNTAYVYASVQGELTDPVGLGAYSDFGTEVYQASNLIINRTPEQLRQQATFAGWDFTNVWDIIGGDGTGSFPFLRAVVPSPAPGMVRPALPEVWETNPGTSLSLTAATTLTFPHANALNPAAFTLELWVRPASVSEAQSLISSRRQGRGYELTIDASGAWSAWTGSATGGLTLSGGLATANTWTHLALVHTGTEARFFVNGRLASEGTSALLPNLGADLVLGGFAGLVDEVRLWSVARSALDLQTWMHEMLIAPMAGLAFHLPLDEGSGATIFDRSPTEGWARMAGTASFVEDVPPAGTFIQGTDNAWYFLSNPTPGITLAQFLEPLWTQSAAGSDVPGVGRSNVFTLNETLGVYEPLSDLNVPAVPGKGYLVRVFRDDVFGTPGTFPKRLSVPRAAAEPTVDLSLQFTSTSLFAGFSLVGNPFPYTMDLSDASWELSGVSPTIYVYDQALNTYRTWNRNTGMGSNEGSPQIAPKQGFLMVASGETPVARAPRVARAPQARRLHKTDAAEEIIRLALHLERGERREETQVLIYPDDRPVNVRDMSRQLEPLGADRFMIYSIDAESGLKIEGYEFAASAAQQIELPVHVEISSSGENVVRFSASGELDPTWKVVLLDTHTGTTTDLLSTPTYTFSTVAPPAKSDEPQEEAGALQQTGVAEIARFRLYVGPRALDAALGELPTEVALAQNYPNPFNATTTITYTLPEPTDVRLEVFDLLGRHVTTLVEGSVSAGHHRVTLNAGALPSGLYTYRLRAGRTVLTRTLTLVR